MRFLEKNISALTRTDPELARQLLDVRVPHWIHVGGADSRSPGLKVGKRTVHSFYDPLTEADRFVDSQTIGDGEDVPLIVFGLGLGYHVEALRRRVPKRKIIVIEPSEEVVRCALETMELGPGVIGSKIVAGGDACKALLEDDDVIRCMDKGTRPEIIVHKPSMRDVMDVFEAFATLTGWFAPPPEGGLRILVVGPVYGGSLPITFYCADALRGLGHHVEVIDNSPYHSSMTCLENLEVRPGHGARLKKNFVEFISNTVLARCAAFKPDLVLAMAQAPLGGPVLRQLRENGIRSAFWFVEDFHQLTYWRDMASSYDFFFAIQRGAFMDKLREAGCRHPCYLPLAASPATHRPLHLTPEVKEEYGSDVSFAGAGYYNRQNFFLGLLDFDMKIWGTEWNPKSHLWERVQRNGERIPTSDFIKIFNSSKVNVNLHSSTCHEKVNPNGDFVNPRTFEIAGSGAFQLVDVRSELSTFFKIGEEMIVYHDIDELREKIVYYLDHPRERAERALRARARVLRDHTYEARMSRMLSIIAEKDRELFSHVRRHDSPEELIRQADGDPGLVDFLSRFKDRKRVTLDDIDNEIRSGEGALDEVEQTFLFMLEMHEWVRENLPKGRA